MISILIFTFCIFNQTSIVSLHPIRLVFLIFRTNYYVMEVFEQPGSGTPALNAMAIRDQCHGNDRKHRTLLADVDVVPARSRNWYISKSRNELQQEC